MNSQPIIQKNHIHDYIFQFKCKLQLSQITIDVIHFLMDGCNSYGYNKCCDVYWGKINHKLSFHMIIMKESIILYNIHIYSSSFLELKSFIQHFVQLVDIVNESA